MDILEYHIMGDRWRFRFSEDYGGDFTMGGVGETCREQRILVRIMVEMLRW